MIRVAAYCRVSTDKADQANSFEAQQRYFRECIEKNPDWELQEIYADTGLSGTSTKKRKRFHAMIQAAEEGKIDLIVTKEVSRFARNTLDTLEYTRALRKKGVGVVFLLDNIHTLDADGELRLTIMASLAQEESRKTSGRVKWGQLRSMQRGVVFGGSLLGYDVENGMLRINPEGARAVRCIFHKYLYENKGSGVIARELREEGIPSSRGNLKWSAPTVLKILKNEKYCGDLIQKKTCTPDFLSHEKKYNRGQEEFVILRDHHEPIIDRETWEAVQRELRRRGHATGQGHGNRYPLSGRIRCAECGSSFMSRTKKNRRGERYKIWRCGRATTEGRLHADAQGNPMGCDVGRQIREDVAMDLLKRSVAAVELDTESVIRNLSCMVESVLRDGPDGDRAERRRLERELEGELEKKQRVLEAFLDHGISREDLRFMNGRCDRSIARLREQLAAMERRRTADARSGEAGEDIRAVIRAVAEGERAAEELCGRLLQYMTVDRDGRVEVALKKLSARWVYVLDGLAAYGGKRAVRSEASVPISVSSPLSSGVGME